MKPKQSIKAINIFVLFALRINHNIFLKCFKYKQMLVSKDIRKLGLLLYIILENSSNFNAENNLKNERTQKRIG